ncbi:MAG: hypothetical protein LBS69_06930 [Prevotellaceae bacterium]|jgi:hypothetical protein|nr:hypothetical protein [Prevotellaceae bacterium]
MKQNNELMPMSAQERKEDIDMLMDSEMMDAVVGGFCNNTCIICDTCFWGKSKPKEKPKDKEKPTEGQGTAE